MKTIFIRPSAIRKFMKERNKQVSSDAIDSIDRAVLRILIRSIELTKNFKRVTHKEVSIISEGLIKTMQ